MIEITERITLAEDELQWEFVRASGPGGQHVNKAATAVQLRFDVAHSPSLPDDVRGRLVELAGQRLKAEGILVIDARRHRSQERNRQEALRRLVDLIRQAAQAPTVRRKTRPTRAAREKRLEKKRQHSETKRLRRPPRREW